MNLKVKKIISLCAIGLTILSSVPAMASSVQNGDLRRPYGEIVDKGLKVSGYGIVNGLAWTQSSYGYAQTSLVAYDGNGGYDPSKTVYNADG